MSAYTKLCDHHEKTRHLSNIASVANWDEAVMMPSGANASRAQSLATLSGIIHQRESDPKLKDLLDQAQASSLDSEWDKANLAHMNRRYVKATALPQALIEQMTQSALECQHAWRQHRQDNNWQAFMPLLKKTFLLKKEATQILAETLGLSVYDAALDEFNQGILQTDIDPLFSELKTALPALIEQAHAMSQARDTLAFDTHFAIDKQIALSRQLMETLTFDFNHGRMDQSHHPFCGGTPSDVRITTRYTKDAFFQGLLAICHETGHGKYEQQLPRQWLNQPVGQSHNMAIHESQSLLVEMQLCRTESFMRCLEPMLIAHFGDHPSLRADNLYRHCRQVAPSLIRVEADELTYPLHVIMRYELEQQLFNDQLAIEDLPLQWDHYMQQLFGLSTLGNDKNGVMQDVHWACGAFGYFPAYTLGSLLAAQLAHSLKQTIPNHETLIAKGDFAPIFAWLKERIHDQASLRSWSGTIEHATGETLSSKYFLESAKARYLSP